MALTALDAKTALLVIDLQQGISPFTNPDTPSLEAVAERTNGLAEAFRRHKLPVAWIVVGGGPFGRTETARSDRNRRWAVEGPPAGFTDLRADLHVEPQDIRLTKTSAGAFSTTDLQQQLTALGVTQIVLAGVGTSNGVEITGIQAYELGFNVTFATDAITEKATASHVDSLENVFPRLGERGASSEIIALLDRSR